MTLVTFSPVIQLPIIDNLIKPFIIDYDMHLNYHITKFIADTYKNIHQALCNNFNNATTSDDYELQSGRNLIKARCNRQYRQVHITPLILIIIKFVILLNKCI